MGDNHGVRLAVRHVADKAAAPRTFGMALCAVTGAALGLLVGVIVGLSL